MLVSAPSLADLAEQNLRSDIVGGHWRPKAWLRVEELKSEYGVGATPIREALSRLVGEGFVRIENNRGFRVAGLTPEDLNDIEWMRATIECAALRQSIKLGGPDWEQGVVIAKRRLADATETTGTDRASLDHWNDQHDAFHVALIASCGSPRALEQQKRLADHHRRYRIALMGDNIRRDEIIDEHCGIADAALARDVTKAVRLLRRNMRVTTNFYAGVLRERLRFPPR